MTLGLFPVTAGDRKFGKRQTHFRGVGILFDQPQILAVGFLHLALLQDGIGIDLAGFLVEAVVLEDVAELDQSTFFISGGQKLHPGKIVALGLLLGTLAPCESKSCKKSQYGGERRSGEAHFEI
jgi:hypothetical protein